MLQQTPKSSAIAEIERLGFTWHEEAQFDLSQLDISRRVQVRDSEHYAPAAQVAQFAVQAAQTAFPPIIVSANNWLVDGNTRVGAQQLRKEKFFHAIVVEADYTDKSTRTDNNFRILAATLNQQGGQRLTPNEARKVARILVDMGWKTEQIGRALGVKATMVHNLRRMLVAEARFAKVGFKEADELSPAAVRAFGSDVVTQLNDIPYKKLADLAAAANLGSNEIRELATEMKATGADVPMITLIDKRRGEMAERIREHSLQGNGKPAASAVLRRVLGHITKYDGNASALVERSPDAMEEHFKAVSTSILILEEVRAAQKELIDG